MSGIDYDDIISAIGYTMSIVKDETNELDDENRDCNASGDEPEG